MAPKQQCAKYEYVVTPMGSKILPVEEPVEPHSKDEESPADYNSGGYLQVKLNDTFKNGRYRVVRKLGWGHFSTVWLVKDTQTSCHTALKVVKSAGRYAETARDEIKLLSRVASVSPLHPGREHIVSFLDSFTHQGPEASHICIVFEPLGENLLALIERNKKKGVPRALVKIIARQALLGLQYLHDECDLVHTDIKPENILISIPDVEAHIQSELCQSPTPTCRRVGVPQPAKSRAGVTIPTVQRPRRQVQIFDSQPLSSPRSPSVGFGINSSSSSLSSGFKSRVHSGIPSASSSYNASIPKVPSGLSMLAPKKEKAVAKKDAAQAPKPVSPSASSSSSSASSISVSTGESRSTFSTPPTSLSQSIGSAIAGILSAPIKEEDESKERIGIPVKGKGKATIENEIECAMSTSWKGSLSMKDKMSSSLKSNSRTAAAHSRSHSGFSSGSWQDPGMAAPAPAVVVSTVVAASGEEDPYDYFDLTRTRNDSTPGATSTRTATSECSSTTTKASPSHTPQPVSGGRDSQSKTSGEPAGKPFVKSPLNPTVNTAPSLLSQTAPCCASPPKGTPSNDAAIQHLNNRPSPPHHVSALSAHMHSHPPPDFGSPCSFPSPLRLSTNVASSPSSLPTPTPTSPEMTGPTTSPAGRLQSPTPTKPGAQMIPPRPSVLTELEEVEEFCGPPISIKIADLGNATPSKKHYTEDIQTRQYRAPEAIVGRKDWDTRADIWSIACVIFELLTAEYLFDPQSQGELFTKDDDHMAQVIELLGDFPLEAKMGGKYSRDLFDHNGNLRYIKTLKPWPLKSVMMQKYLYSEADADALCDFLLPMLTPDFHRRTRAVDMIDHPWLNVTPADEVVGEW
ncbi:kinase-like domain-containing protein [Schizophyllum amplum]|uniref:non-specific serine/threonine protein kinase n=1 Tax=Schizophyllum amplum TaxID=97359 RepID=A0A550CMH4_9AGAR|nr:kinase-like domain-containing protein [Auriculariopsis ampla]